jgi:hypothetical protein
MITSNFVSVIKRRLDRAGSYFANIQMLITSTILVKIFGIKSWWIYVLGGIILLFIKYSIGYLDEKKKVLSNEQKGYTDENPAIQQILKDLEYLKTRLT